MPRNQINDCRPLLSRWRVDPQIGGNAAAWEVLAQSQAQLERLPADLHPTLLQALSRKGIQSIYSHQAEALRAIWNGLCPVIITSTASGKTLCYNLPVLDHLLRDPAGRALFLFPTKALTQDQLSGLRNLLETPQDAAVNAAIYDGDTPSNQRPVIRSKARIVLSNPDMLHTAILPHHTAWTAFFRDLRFVVLDEMHIYRGVFGSHVANVIRRLRRITRFYGGNPQFILTSATIANPMELAERLIQPDRGQADLVLIDRDGAPHGQKHFLIYNPPVTNAELGIRRSAVQESVRLAGELLDNNIQTIIFGRTRRSVEILLTLLRERARDGENRQGSIRGYRSGYLPQERRAIEQGLRNGQVRAVVATTALELGIDIGALGAAIMVGYPGSIAAAWQQAGRAGRGEDTSLAILVATADPLDQFLATHPEYFFGRSPEQALVNPDNLLILLAHIRCASFELPFHRDEHFGDLDPERVNDFLDFLVQERVLHRSREKYFWMADQYPAQMVSLRSASADNILLHESSSDPEETNQTHVIGAVDRLSALWMVHPKAIYMHEGQTYLVNELDLETNTARLGRIETDYYTEALTETSVQAVETLQEEPVHGGTKTYGEILVTSQVTGFRQVDWQTRQQIGQGELELPATELQTSAYWLTLADETVAGLQELGLWTNAPNQYGPTWPRQRERARERDGFRCQVCGLAETNRAHDVHHKTPFRSFASAQAANQLENLITLCPACHRRAEAVVRMRSGLAGLSFVLSHLAPLFVMCDSRDLGVHSDPQSPLSAGHPTIIIYDQAPGGIGLSQRIFEIHSDLIGRARELVGECPCTDGCPSCVGPGGEVGMGSKRETLAILDHLTGYP